METSRSRTMPRVLAALAATGLVLLQSMASAEAAPSHYTIQFTGSSVTGTLPTGSFDYDAATPAFSNFIVQWAGLSFDLTDEANGPLIFGTPATVCGVNDASASFLLLSKDSCLMADADPLPPKGWDIDLFDEKTANLAFIGSGFNGRSMFFAASAATDFADGEKCIDRRDCAQGDWSITLVPPPVSVPEPATLALIGLAGLVASLRRRKA